MSSPLERLYKTKLALLSTIVTVVGIALMVIAHWASGSMAVTWLNALPVMDVGSALFTTGLIAIAFAYIDQADAETRANERLRKILAEEAPAIRDAVVDGFAFAPDSLTNVASDKTLDRIVENTLGIRLGDKELAADAYRDLKQQIIGARQRWEDAHVSVALAPWKKGPVSGKGSMFVATISWEYRFTPSSPVLRFSCVSDLDAFRELSADPTSTMAWYFDPVGNLDASSPEVFELVQVAVNGKNQSIRRTTRKGGQTYACTLNDDVDPKSEVTISYTYRVLVQRHGHTLHLDLSQPTKNFRAELWYGDCGIRRMNVLDYLSGPRQPRYRHLEASDPSPSVEVAYEGWTFPKGGVAFVWVLEDEMDGSRPQA
ncbi:hypothetical protein [Streptomyces ipomoeae]|uniref:Uncharacterized protein n=1 Tax=Streptomyces ipomoeae 91-03 TaxID=698759 RepID=L1KRH5_9ACTN|nr:hypothetical protein [Streptomyces ipomoeae]EKX63090.1 hypothetical protein STRIP9103_01242 [Streptomyces ipomoeae 91-03]MDX2698904.1 hypothetical protein [Streptomyces ipomoeae]MDX2844167.1 hypothetical protein [Streptomyces ipomoeae]